MMENGDIIGKLEIENKMDQMIFLKFILKKIFKTGN
jgi:hypothetical protein